jgi:peptide/nickel transport system ATP-binding protein
LIFVSHDLTVVRRVCDTVAVLHHGDLVELGATERVYRAPQHPYTRRLIAAVPTIRQALAGVDAAGLVRNVHEAGVDPTDDPEEAAQWR